MAEEKDALCLADANQNTQKEAVKFQINHIHSEYQ